MNTIIVLDLDGVLAVRDIAYDTFAKHGLGEEFSKVSEAIAEAVKRGGEFDNKRAYAAQTVEYMVKKYPGKIHINDIKEVAKKTRLMRGAKRLIQLLKKYPDVDIYIVSAAYRPGAEIIAEKLGIPSEKVIATELDIDDEGKVIGVRGNAIGGIHKARAIEEISKITGIPIQNFVAIGDSITDRGMIKRVHERGGLAIAFNANKDLIEGNPDLIVAGKRLDHLHGIIKAFVEKGKGAAIKKALRSFFRYRLSPKGFYFVIPASKSVKRAMKVSQRTRKKVREKYAKLR